MKHPFFNAEAIKWAFSANHGSFCSLFAKKQRYKTPKKGTNFSKILESARNVSPGVPILAEIAASRGTRFKKTPENAQPEEGPDTRFLRPK